MDYAEIRIALDKALQIIPYRADEGVHPYESVLQNPSAVGRFPELTGEPMMQRFILSIHEPDGMFETARLSHWFGRRDEQSVRCFQFGFFFRDRSLFQRFENCTMFAGNLLSALSKDTIACDGEPFLLETQPALLRLEGLSGWIMDLYVAGNGADQNAARSRLDKNLEGLIPLLQNGGAPPL